MSVKTKSCSLNCWQVIANMLYSIHEVGDQIPQCVKKTDKTPPKELTLARKRMKEWKHVDA